MDLLRKDSCQYCCIQCLLTPQQASVDPRLSWRLLDTHRQVWLSLLWDHCYFLLGPGVHKILFVSSKSVFPQSCGSSVIKSHWPSNYLGVLSTFARSQVGKSVVGPRTFATVQELLWYNCSPVCGLSAWWLCVGAHTLSPRSAATRAPVPMAGCCWAMPTQEPLKHSKPGQPQSLVGSLGPGAQKVLFEPSECLWRVWGLILNMISSLLPSCWGFSFAFIH